MKALIVEKPGVMRLDELPRPSIGAEEVLVKVAQAGICRSDYEVIDGTRLEAYVSYPIVLGHELAGTIIETGASVKRLHEGMRVTAEAILRCDSCERCLSGQSNLCQNYDEIGFVRHGSFAEYVALPAHVVHPVPETFSFEKASLAEPVACAVRNVMRAELIPGDSLAIVGPGSMGLLSTMAATLYSPEKIILVGVQQNRLDLGVRCGATHTINARETDPVACIQELTDGRGADVVIECAGSPQTVKQSVQMVRRGGRVVWLGLPGSDVATDLIIDEIVFKELAIQASLAYTRESFAFSLKLMVTNKIDPTPIISHRFPLDDWENAFQIVKEQREGAIKGLLSPE